jgi:hypothetical protein
MIHGPRLVPVLAFALGVVCGVGGAACRPLAGGWGRVRILESHLTATSWTVVVDDQGQGVELFVDGSPRRGLCRRGGQGIRCWVSGLRPGYHRLAVTVAGRGTSRRSGLSATRKPLDEVFYGVLLDRFVDGDASNNLRVNSGDPTAAHGGDLRGLRRRLGHLKRLGVTTVVISPLWESSRVNPKAGALPRYVGTRPLSPRRLSRSLGSARSLMRLMRAARRRGLRVVLDLPRAGADLGSYVATVSTWLSRTFADGVRLGPFGPGEELAWAAATARLHRAHTPLLLIHHGTGDVGRLRSALAKGPASVGLIESETAGRALLAWVGGASGAAAAPGPMTKPLPRGVVRILSSHRAPVLVRRLSSGARADLSLTLHLLLAEIPKVYYADEMAQPPRVQAHPDMDWTEVKDGPRGRLIRKILGLRRGVVALRRGDQTVVRRGDVLMVGRGLGRCRVVVLANRSDKSRELLLDTRQLGWPAQQGDMELVDRLRGRGYTLVKNRLTIELKPVSARVLVVAGSGACSG